MKIWFRVKYQDLIFIKILHINFKHFTKDFHFEHLRWNTIKTMNIFSFLSKQIFNSIRMGRLYVLIPIQYIILNISKHMASHNSHAPYNLFEGFCQMPIDDQHQSTHSNELKPHGLIELKTSANEKVDHQLVSAFIKSGHRDYQISFQAEFMSEHQDAFKFQLKNFMESSFKNYNTELTTFQYSEIFGEMLESGSFDNQEDILQILEDKSKLLGEIKKFQKLNKFLEFVFETLPMKVASQILYLIQFGMEKYNKNTEPQQNQFNNLFGLERGDYINMNSNIITPNECIENSKLFTEQFCKNQSKCEKIKYLSLSEVQKSELNQEKEINKSFRKFIEFLFSTMIFLMEQFFENPYGQSYTTKRERASLEEYYEINESELQSSSTANINFGKPTKRVH